VRTTFLAPTSSPSRTATVLSDIESGLRQRHRAEIFVAVVLGFPALDVERRVLPDRSGVRPASIAVR